MQVVMLPCVCPYTCVCMCVSWSPFPFTSVDRWHPLALWLACQRLNMLMGARLQASHSYINVNGTPRPILPTHTHTCTTSPLTVQDWFGCYPSAELTEDSAGIASDTAKQSPNASNCQRGWGSWQGEMTATKCPNQEKFSWKPSRKLRTPLFLLSYSNDASVDTSSSPLWGKWQTSSESRSVCAVTPHTDWDWVWIVGKHSPCCQKYIFFSPLKGKEFQNVQ